MGIKDLKTHAINPCKNTTRLLRHLGSFKVTEFGTNWKPVCNFILVNNTNLFPCIVLYCIIRVTIEAEACMTVYGQCWGQISSTYCTAPLCIQGMCLYEWCAAADTIVTARVSLLVEPWAVCLQYAAWQPVSSGPYALAALSDQQPARLPGEVIAGSGATVTGAVPRAICYLTSRTHHGLRHSYSWA